MNQTYFRDSTLAATYLPLVCPQHPQALIRHSWDQNHYVMNGYPAGTGWKSNHRYECAECGRELAAEATNA